MFWMRPARPDGGGNGRRGIGDAPRKSRGATRRDAFVAFRTAYVLEAPSGKKGRCRVFATFLSLEAFLRVFV